MAADAHDSHTILYIEDDPDSRRLVQRILESEGYIVTQAEDGLSGLRVARRLHPDLILIDTKIAGMTGFEVATRLKEQSETRDIPIVALTAASLNSDRERALVAGCDGFIPKPIDVDALPHLVARFLSGARERVTNEVRLQRLEEYNQVLVSRLEAALTELQKAHAELRRLDRMKKDFVLLASHDLRTPTALIYGYINLLKMELDNLAVDERLGEMIDRISTATRRLNEVVEAIVNVSLIDSRKIDITPQPLNLYQVVEAVVQELQPVVKQRNQHLETRDLSALPEIQGDANYLRRALSNLVDSAIKHTPDGGTISLDAHREHEALHITVSDTGIGIDPDEQVHIFDKFYILESTTDRLSERGTFVSGGLGLGLTVAHDIIAAHGGRIWIESEGRHAAHLPGSRFHVLLPITRPPAPAAPADD